jgi:hypothetical protein
MCCVVAVVVVVVVVVVVIGAAAVVGNNLTRSHVIMTRWKSSVLQEFSEKLPLYSVDVPLATRKEYGCNMMDHLHNLAEVTEVFNTSFDAERPI